MKVGDYVYSDKVSVSYLTSGKRYRVDVADDEYFRIWDDSGYHLWCLVTECAHLDGGDWIVVPKEEAENRDAPVLTPKWERLFDAAIEQAARDERQKVVDELIEVYQRRVSSRKGGKPNRADEFLLAVIQSIAGVDPACAALGEK